MTHRCPSFSHYLPFFAFLLSSVWFSSLGRLRSRSLSLQVGRRRQTFWTRWFFLRSPLLFCQSVPEASPVTMPLLLCHRPFFFFLNAIGLNELNRSPPSSWKPRIIFYRIILIKINVRTMKLWLRATIPDSYFSNILFSLVLAKFNEVGAGPEAPNQKHGQMYLTGNSWTHAQTQWAAGASGSRLLYSNTSTSGVAERKEVGQARVKSGDGSSRWTTRKHGHEGEEKKAWITKTGLILRNNVIRRKLEIRLKEPHTDEHQGAADRYR